MLNRFGKKTSRAAGRKDGRPLGAIAAAVTAGAVLLGVASCATGQQTSRATGTERPGTSQPGTSRPSTAAPAGIAADLATVAQTKVFFGHQSVGMNILEGVSAVYEAHDLGAPPIEENATDPGPRGGFIDHMFIGENEEPVLKIEDFAAKLRSGLGGQVDVAMMKFCFVDITSGTDVGALFATYRTTLAALQREFPKVTFVYATVPLTTGPGADNVARQRLNALIRQQYAPGGHLFDLAAAESTAPDGSRVTGTFEGHRYYALYRGYASDPGHLNARGAKAVATAWLRAVAQASRR